MTRPPGRTTPRRRAPRRDRPPRAARAPRPLRRTTRSRSARGSRRRSRRARRSDPSRPRSSSTTGRRRARCTRVPVSGERDQAGADAELDDAPGGRKVSAPRRRKRARPGSRLASVVGVGNAVERERLFNGDSVRAAAAIRRARERAPGSLARSSARRSSRIAVRSGSAASAARSASASALPCAASVSILRGLKPSRYAGSVVTR